MVYWNKGALRRNCRHKYGETSFSPSRVFLFSRNSRERFRDLILWHSFGLGGPGILGQLPPPHHVTSEVFNVGGCLTYGD